MSQVLKIPLLDTVYDELDDAFIDGEQTAHDFMWGLIRTLCRDAKYTKLNKNCIVKLIKDNKEIQDQLKLKNVNLEKIPSDSDWIPKNMDKEDVKCFEHKVSDKTMEYLELYASFAVLRHQKYSDSLESYNKQRLAELIENKANDKIVNDAKKDFAQTIKKFREATPKCIEEVIFASLSQAIGKKIQENIEKELDKDNEEFYPKEEKPIKVKPSR